MIISTFDTELITLIAQGMCTKEIAEIIHGRTDALEAHINRLMKRLDVKNRCHLVAFAYEKGILEVKGDLISLKG